MRLCFPNNEHPDVLIAPGDTAIGSAPDSAIVLSAPGIVPHHARLTVSDRSIVLAAGEGGARIHVNARPVVEKAILRLGDVVSLDTIKFTLKPDRDDSIRTDVPGHATPPPATADGSDAMTRTRQLPPRVVLRGVSGGHFGKIVPVRGRLLIGRGSDCGLILDEPEMSRHHAVIENTGDGIYLRDLGSANGTFVNGVLVRDAVLHTDDQIAFDRNRFLLEAPSLPTRGDLALAPPAAQEVNITQTMRAIDKPASAPASSAEERNRNDIWWLIGAAALIAAGIAVLLYISL
ncbi:MAG: FHA domain-containing protein [Xanthomonadaceae bacterium]|nr:FHA domain-containing protein [Xanthomonadaceae bacterium]